MQPNDIDREIRRTTQVNSRVAQAEVNLVWSAVLALAVAVAAIPLSALGWGIVGAVLFVVMLGKTVGQAIELREALAAQARFAGRRGRGRTIRDLEGEMGFDPIAEFPDDLKEAMRES